MTSTTFLKKIRSTNYRLLGLVGQGQFGQVYCAIHRKTGRLVALKNLNRDRFPTHQFLRELRFLLSLNHPHIANCLALEQSENGRQLVLDYCEGGTLRDILEQETQLTLAEILTLVDEVLEALEQAQKAKIVHCDIKPENILLTLTADGWHAKVSDFGIARLSQEFQGNQTGATGSPAYMAPERFYKQYAVSSDLYAVGIVLYELLMGDRPFSGSYNQLMVAHLNHPVKVPETIPPGVRSLLTKSMEKLMARRFQNAAAMKAAIVQVRQTLTAAELRDRFPKPLVAPPRSSSRAQAVLPLPATGEGVCVLYPRPEQAQVIAFANQTAWVWNLPKAETNSYELPAHHQKWNFAAPISSIVNTAQGAIAATAHDLYQLGPEQSPQQLAHFDEAVRLVPGGQRWVMVQTQAAPYQFWLIDTAGQRVAMPRSIRLDPFNGQLISLFLNDRYLLLADAQAAKTDFQVLSRRGKRYGRLSINAPIHQLLPSQQAFRMLAQAGTQKRDLLVIQVKPYRVMRCRLDITADWIGELVTGYVVISRDGQLRLLNFQGQTIGHVDDLPTPRAIAFHPPHQIWISTEQGQKHQLYCIDIRTLDLDIVF